MEYIIFRPLNRKCLCGSVNLPRGAKCVENDGVIYYKDKAICLNASQIAKEHFACNDDGLGLKRGDLSYSIAFAKPLTTLQQNVARDTPSINRYIRDDCQSILFTDSFFHAPILDLLSVKAKLGVR